MFLFQSSINVSGSTNKRSETTQNILNYKFDIKNFGRVLDEMKKDNSQFDFFINTAIGPGHLRTLRQLESERGKDLAAQCANYYDGLKHDINYYGLNYLLNDDKTYQQLKGKCEYYSEKKGPAFEQAVKDLSKYIHGAYPMVIVQGSLNNANAEQNSYVAIAKISGTGEVEFRYVGYKPWIDYKKNEKTGKMEEQEVHAPTDLMAGKESAKPQYKWTRKQFEKKEDKQETVKDIIGDIEKFPAGINTNGALTKAVTTILNDKAMNEAFDRDYYQQSFTWNFKGDDGNFYNIMLTSEDKTKDRTPGENALSDRKIRLSVSLFGSDGSTYENVKTENSSDFSLGVRDITKLYNLYMAKIDPTTSYKFYVKQMPTLSNTVKLDDIVAVGPGEKVPEGYTQVNFKISQNLHRDIKKGDVTVRQILSSDLLVEVEPVRNEETAKK